VKQGFLEHPPHGLAHTLRGVIARQQSVGELAPDLARLDLPVLVVVGGADRGSLEPSRALARFLPDARLVVVDGAGHVVNLAQPAAFNAALAEFLAGLDRA
jgi:pimeloyl-ACP methyl ester carboxylesterase